jgi:hypothetical protein
MIYYLVYIKFIDKLGKRYSRILYGLSEEEVKTTIAIPYEESRIFHFCGYDVEKEMIEQILIFGTSIKYGTELILPNGKNATEEEDSNYKIHCFAKRKPRVILGLANDRFLHPSVTESPKQDTTFTKMI